MGSSTGSLAIFKAGWQKYRNTFSVMENISKVFMINAACPDTFEGELNKDIMIYAINGKDDDSTPGWVCNNLKKSKNYSNIILLSYDGAHHFESDHYGKTKFEAKGQHILPTCSINYKKNLHSVVKVRNSNKQRDAEEKGFNKEHRKWIYNNCLKEGNYMITFLMRSATNDDIAQILVNGQIVKMHKSLTGEKSQQTTVTINLKRGDYVQGGGVAGGGTGAYNILVNFQIIRL